MNPGSPSTCSWPRFCESSRPITASSAQVPSASTGGGKKSYLESSAFLQAHLAARGLMQPRVRRSLRQPAFWQNRPMAGKVRIGVSGWRYAPWRGNFYPQGLPQARELAYAAEIFPSIELNGSFYSLQRPSSYARWARQTPPGFVFAVKGSRYITHMLRLRHVETAVANFFASGLFELDGKLGPILWQLSDRHRLDAGRLEEFCALLPRSFVAARDLGLVSGASPDPVRLNRQDGIASAP